MTGPQVTNVYGHVVLLLLLQLITSVGVAKQGVRGVHAVRVAARWCPSEELQDSSSMLKLRPFRVINP
jgi:hypothetical protein